MSRVIKFRVWNQVSSRYETTWVISQTGDIGEWEGGYDPRNRAVLTVEQFTGLVDKNGKEIYEGDILGSSEDKDLDGLDMPNDTYPYDWWERGEVKYYDELGRFGMLFWSPYGGEGYTGHEEHIHQYLDRWYVLGNIHENSDLIVSIAIDKDVKKPII